MNVICRISKDIGYGVTANIAASQKVHAAARGSIPRTRIFAEVCNAVCMKAYLKLTVIKLKRTFRLLSAPHPPFFEHASKLA